jgi:outer membrane receptor for ferrienterochelin and colicin
VAADAVELKGKTILLKSNNLKDVEFMAKGLSESDKKSGVTFSGVSLILIDGEKKTKKELDALSPDQIKSVQVLKGDALIKEYGPDAKNGVMKITTKKKADL